MCMQWKCTLSLTHYWKDGLRTMDVSCGSCGSGGLQEGVSEEIGVRTQVNSQLCCLYIYIYKVNKTFSKNVQECRDGSAKTTATRCRDRAYKHCTNNPIPTSVFVQS